MLEIKDLQTAYGKIEALKGVSLNANQGQVTCLLGPNGAGKSTLMMSVAGILKPKRGHIKFCDEDITGKSPADIVSRGLALVPENRLVFPALDVRENLMAGAFRRRDHALIRADIDAMFDRFPRLRERHNQPAGTLSGGEQQMLAVARALMSRPKLLLMDEPAAGMNAEEIDDLNQRIRQLKNAGKTILLIEHHMELVMDVCDRIAVLNFGQKIAEGTPSEVQDDPHVQGAYLGDDSTEPA